MIKRVKIENFQSHQDTEIFFCDGVNMLIGSSDCGKSAIMRAIRWVFRNEPQGADFITHGKKKTTVEIELDNCLVRRVRSSTENAYYLNKQEFKAFKNDVPEEIVRALNVDSISWQSQLDAPFLLSATSGEVARYLNRVSNLTIIDDCLSCSAMKKKQTVQKVRFLEEECETKKLQIQQMGDIDSLKVRFDRIERINDKTLEADREVFALDTLTSSLKRVQEQILEAPPLQDLKKQLESIAVFQKEYEELCKQIIMIRNLCRDFRQVSSRISKLSQVPKNLQFEKAEDLFKKYERTLKERDPLKDLIEDIQDCAADIQDHEKEVETSKSIFKKEMGDSCPLCGASL